MFNIIRIIGIDMKTKTTTGYKFVTSKMKSMNGDQKWKMGKWYKHEGKLEICKSGFHASPTPLDSLEYIYGNRWFVVEARGEIQQDGNKFVASEMRLVQEIPVKKVVLPFAIFCARRCLANYEKKYPDDSRPRKAIEAAEKYMKNPTEENRIAARSAADAAGSAAWFAAGSAADAAGYAVGYAAWFAAGSAARKAQNEELNRLIEKAINFK